MNSFKGNNKEKELKEENRKYFSILTVDVVDDDWLLFVFVVVDVPPDDDVGACLAVCSKNAGKGFDPPNLIALLLPPLFEENDGGWTTSGLFESIEDWKRCDDDDVADCEDIDDEPKPPEKPSEEFLDGCFLFSRRKRWSSFAFSSIFSLASLSWAFYK